MLKERSAGAVLFSEDKTREYLLLKYPHGHWGFVKGKLEINESEQEAVLREIKEEAGLDKKDLSFITGFRAINQYFYCRNGHTVHKDVAYYLVCSNTKSVMLSHEHTDFAWLQMQDALKRITYSNTSDIFKQAIYYLD